MSAGAMCLICRKYLTRGEHGCKCVVPAPSMDGTTPINRRCGVCACPSPRWTLCQRCDTRGPYAGTARPWPETDDFVLGEAT